MVELNERLNELLDAQLSECRWLKEEQEKFERSLAGVSLERDKLGELVQDMQEKISKLTEASRLLEFEREKNRDLEMRANILNEEKRHLNSLLEDRQREANNKHGHFIEESEKNRQLIDQLAHYEHSVKSLEEKIELLALENEKLGSALEEKEDLNYRVSYAKEELEKKTSIIEEEIGRFSNRELQFKGRVENLEDRLVKLLHENNRLHDVLKENEQRWQVGKLEVD